MVVGFGLELWYWVLGRKKGVEASDGVGVGYLSLSSPTGRV